MSYTSRFGVSRIANLTGDPPEGAFIMPSTVRAGLGGRLTRQRNRERSPAYVAYCEPRSATRPETRRKQVIPPEKVREKAEAARRKEAEARGRSLAKLPLELFTYILRVEVEALPLRDQQNRRYQLRTVHRAWRDACSTFGDDLICISSLSNLNKLLAIVRQPDVFGHSHLQHSLERLSVNLGTKVGCYEEGERTVALIADACGQLREIEHVSGKRNAPMTRSAEDAIARHQKLRTISLPASEYLRDDCVRGIGLTPLLRRLDNLILLDTQNMRIRRSLATGQKARFSLELIGNGTFGLLAPVTKIIGGALITLHVDHTQPVTSLNLGQVARNCPDLAHIDVGYVQGWPDTIKSVLATFKRAQQFWIATRAEQLAQVLEASLATSAIVVGLRATRGRFSTSDIVNVLGKLPIASLPTRRSLILYREDFPWHDMHRFRSLQVMAADRGIELSLRSRVRKLTPAR